MEFFLTKEELKGLIKDNPAGQGQERTPMILIREKNHSNKNDFLQKGF